MKKPRVIIRTAGSHRIYVEHNGERTVYALKAKRELEIARSSKKIWRLAFGRARYANSDQPSDRSAALTSLWLGPASGLTAGAGPFPILRRIAPGVAL